MKNTELYIKCLVLRYREQTKTINSSPIVEKILNYWNIEEDKVMGDEAERMKDFKDFLKIYNQHPDKYTKKSLIEQLKITFMGYPDYVMVVQDFLNDKDFKDEDVEKMRGELLDYVRRRELETLLKQSLSLLRKDKVLDTTNLATTLKSLEKVEKDKNVIQVMDIDNEDNVLEVADKAVKMNESEGRIKTGFPKMNKALDGGFRRGEFVMIGALRFNYKSGILRTLFLQLPFHNVPNEANGKKPLILYIGFEDMQETNLTFTYSYLYCNEHHKAPPKDVKAEEMAKYVTEKMKNVPYKCVVARADPAIFSLDKIISLIDSYIDKGYDVQACMIDYLSKIAPKGANGETSHDTIKQTYQTAYEEISKKRNILTITAHQLSTSSRDIAYGGSEPKDFVKFLPGRGATENCKSLDQIVDIEMYCHVYTDKMTNTGYLAVQLGKHRLSPTTPDQFKYFTLKFIQNGTLIEDDSKTDDSVFVDDLL